MIHQDSADPLHTLGCSPPEYPTKEFIEAHAHRYENWKPYVPQSKPQHRPSNAQQIEEEIDETALAILKITLSAIIIGMMSATIAVLMSIIWKGIGDDIMDWWFSIFHYSYRRIPHTATSAHNHP